MTVADRNRFLILFAGITVVLSIAGISSAIVFFAYRLADIMPNDVSHTIFFPYNVQAVTIALSITPVIASSLLIYIFIIFEKTRTVEIFFFALYIFAIAFEGLRLFLPLACIVPLSAVYGNTITHAVFFFRFFATLSLLAAGLFAHTVFTRELLPTVFFLSFISFVLTKALPITTPAKVSYMLLSYRKMPLPFTVIICILSILSFLVVGIYRKIPEYRFCAFSLCILSAGYGGIIYFSEWLLLGLSCFAFLVGGILFIRAVHQYYLWQ